VNGGDRAGEIPRILRAPKANTSGRLKEKGRMGLGAGVANHGYGCGGKTGKGAERKTKNKNRTVVQGITGRKKGEAGEFTNKWKGY